MNSETARAVLNVATIVLSAAGLFVLFKIRKLLFEKDVLEVDFAMPDFPNRDHMTDQEIIDSLLHDKSFRQMVEQDVGHVSRVRVDWGARQILIFGAREARSMNIDTLLNSFRWKMN